MAHRNPAEIGFVEMLRGLLTEEERLVLYNNPGKVKALARSLLPQRNTGKNAFVVLLSDEVAHIFIGFFLLGVAELES